MKIVQDTLVLAFDVTFSFSNFTLKKGRLGGRGHVHRRWHKLFTCLLGIGEEEAQLFLPSGGLKKNEKES
jgi:hypothetical protein